jgi:hypothetical protein
MKECFDELSMSGNFSVILTLRPFVLSLSPRLPDMLESFELVDSTSRPLPLARDNHETHRIERRN